MTLHKWLTIAILLLVPGLARGGSVTLVIDPDAGTAKLLGGRLETTVPDLAPRAGAIADALARGDDASEARRALGHDLLDPLAEALRDATQWTIQPAGETAETPGSLAVIPTLVAAWTDGAPILSHHALAFAWPAAIHTPVSRASSPVAKPSVLLAAPFHRGIAPRIDDPDTLRQALTTAVKTVRLIPRNETSADDLRRALETVPPALLWIRADREALRRLSPAAGAFPSLLVWSLPSRLDLANPGLTPLLVASGGRAPATILVQGWPTTETALSRVAALFADGLARGLDAGSALHEAQRRALSEGLDLATVASLTLVGDPRTQIRLDRASWLRRKLGKL